MAIKKRKTDLFTPEGTTVILSDLKRTFSLHLLRLLAQEIVLMKKLKIPAQEAFQWQSKLLTDALVKKNKISGESEIKSPKEIKGDE